MQYQPEPNSFETPWSMHQKVDCVKNWSIEKLVTAVKRWYVRENGSPALFANPLRGWVHDFQERGIVAHRPRYVRSRTRIDKASRTEHAFEENPRKSLGVVSAELGFHFNREMFKRKSEKSAYKISFVQHLLQEDNHLRLDYDQTTRHEWRNGSEYLERIFFSNGWIFHTIEVVNQHN